MTLTRLLIGILATWRISALLCYDDGPLDVFRRIRDWAARWAFLSGLLGCFWCTSVWVGVGVSMFMVAVLRLPLYWLALLPFAFSGGAILLTHGGDDLWQEQTQ